MGKLFNQMISWIVFVLLITTVNNQNCGSDDQQFLATFHPHLDAFWLNFDNQLKDINFKPAGFLYSMNQRNSKQIFNSMLQALSGNQQRKYFITEIVFFKDWYQYISKQAQNKVNKLIQNGQLQIANGGWVQNDEAVCYYDDIFDQYTIGMNYLYQNFNQQVKIGWATDSFGHSHSQAAVLHLLGVQFQGIQRVDDRYIHQHQKGPLLQFYWSAVSDSNNLTYGGVLNHIRHFLHEVNDLRRANQQMIKQDFTQLQKTMLKYYKKNKLFRFLGNDFQQFIPQQFENLERAFNQLNKQRGKTTCKTFKYGNPSDYLELISNYYDKNQLRVRQYDLIPNWDQERYWTGYYTTDPQLKKKCKDFSRLVNFYRKSLMQLNQIKKNANKLQDSEQLLAVLQHHDGITATSKTYIEDEFKKRMKDRSTQLINSISRLYGASDANPIVCHFYENHNQCQITQAQAAGSQLKQLHIITHGGSKKQKIQLILPSGTYYNIVEQQQDLFCQQPEGKCTLVFEASLHPGVNTYTLEHQTKSQMENVITVLDKQTVLSQMSYSGRDFTIGVQKNTNSSIKYQYGDGQFFNIGLYTSPNQGRGKQTFSWNKFGVRSDRSENIMAGMYIMANDGKITPLTEPFTSSKFAEGKIFTKAIFNSNASQIRITIKNDQPNIIDVIHKFKPVNRQTQDYFMKVSSNVKSDTLFHDSNGFLVAKRPLNKRPDYDFVIKPDDYINGNTYPACSFAYLINDDKKMLFFTDRAQGVASYQQDLLINFDRLAMDDYKGVGQVYMRFIQNTFRYKFALISANDDTERIWQRNYDEMLMGYLFKSNFDSLNYKKESSSQISHTPGMGPQTRLKYSIYILNNNQYVLRLQNLGEFSPIFVNKFTGQQGSYTWKIQQIGLNINFVDIKDSYANGIPIQQKWRRHWSKDKNEINLGNQANQKQKTFVLKPLQIRSFRINTSSSIQIKQMKSNAHSLRIQKQLTGATPLKSTFMRRCF